MLKHGTPIVHYEWERKTLPPTVWNLFTWGAWWFNRLDSGRVLIGKICFAGYHTFVCHQVVNVFFHLTIHDNFHVVELVGNIARQPLEQLLGFNLLLSIVRHEETNYDIGQVLLGNFLLLQLYVL